MGYLDVLDKLNKFTVDRMVLSDFNEAWNSDGSVDVTTTTANATVHSNAIKIDSMQADSVIYTSLEEVLDLFKQDNVQLHILTDTLISEGDLVLVLSDSAHLVPAVVKIDLPEIPADTPINIKLTVPESYQKLLSNVKSVGLKSNTDLSATTFYISKIDANSEKYTITKEKLESAEKSGQQFVLSKIGEDTIPSKLEDAVYLAAAGYVWMRKYDHEKDTWDFNNNQTKNYGSRLLKEAETRCEEYIFGKDTNTETSDIKEDINTDLIGSSKII